MESKTNTEFKAVDKELKQKCDNNFELLKRLNYYFPNVVVTELTRLISNVSTVGGEEAIYVPILLG